MNINPRNPQINTLHALYTKNVQSMPGRSSVDHHSHKGLQATAHQVLAVVPRQIMCPWLSTITQRKHSVKCPTQRCMYIVIYPTTGKHKHSVASQGFQILCTYMPILGPLRYPNTNGHKNPWHHPSPITNHFSF